MRHVVLPQQCQCNLPQHLRGLGEIVEDDILVRSVGGARGAGTIGECRNAQIASYIVPVGIDDDKALFPLLHFGKMCWHAPRISRCLRVFQ
jgi:hypothetical protein